MSFALLPPASWQPALSAFAASLRLFVPHPLRSAATHPPAAVLGSPAGRCGLRLDCLIACAYAAAIKAVASCSALRGRHGFCPKKKSKNHARPSLLHVPAPGLVPRPPGPPPLLHSQTARARKGYSPQPVRSSLIAACPLSVGRNRFFLGTKA